MTTQDQLLTKIRAVIEQVAGADRTPAGCTADTPLGDGFWLDSVELVEVLVACELEFGIVLDDAASVDEGAFGTLGSLAELIRSRQSAGHPL